MVPAEYQLCVPQPEPVEKERWPQLTTLIREHEEIVFKLLRAVDECDVVNEVNASDAGNVKGNRWVKLQEVVFGGREDGTRGLIPEFPAIDTKKCNRGRGWKWVKREAVVMTDRPSVTPLFHL